VRRRDVVYLRRAAFLAARHFRIDPHLVILAKALSGGLIPVGAAAKSVRTYITVQ